MGTIHACAVLCRAEAPRRYSWYSAEPKRCSNVKFRLGGPDPGTRAPAHNIAAGLGPQREDGALFS